VLIFETVREREEERVREGDEIGERHDYNKDTTDKRRRDEMGAQR
jgi:hypothetical protein